MRTYLAIVLLSSGLVAACGDDGGGSTPTPDAKPSDIDVVACASGEKGPITTTGSSTDGVFTPNALTVAVGDTVKFVMPSEHDVVPDVGGDVNLKVGFSETKCLKFKAAGAYKFHCGPHSFKGTVTVQ